MFYCPLPDAEAKNLRKTTIIGAVIAALFSIIGLPLANYAALHNYEYNPYALKFIPQTEQIYGITDLKLKTSNGEWTQHSNDKLPADHTEASWLNGNTYEQGIILVKDNTIGLVDHNGNLIQPKNQTPTN